MTKDTINMLLEKINKQSPSSIYLHVTATHNLLYCKSRCLDGNLSILFTYLQTIGISVGISFMVKTQRILLKQRTTSVTIHSMQNMHSNWSS